jgi:GxxExxY protein
MINHLSAPLPIDVDQITSQVIAACIAVHRELGPGLLESVYQRAVSIELDSRGVSHDVERAVPILFRGELIGQYRLDLIVDDRVIVELKAVERFAPIHLAQAISYLRLTGLRVALLVNFNVPVLKAGIRRVVL